MNDRAELVAAVHTVEAIGKQEQAFQFSAALFIDKQRFVKRARPSLTASLLDLPWPTLRGT
jgi:hypothetical protein